MPQQGIINLHMARYSHLSKTSREMQFWLLKHGYKAMEMHNSFLLKETGFCTRDCFELGDAPAGHH
jgi:hypothetical protein